MALVAIFALLSSPLVYNFTGKIFGGNGCSDAKSIFIHTLVYALLVFLLMYSSTPVEKYGCEPNSTIAEDSPLIPAYSFYNGYQGLANPAGMKNYNTAYLMAEKAGCDSCVDAAQECMLNPFNQTCKMKTDKCKKECKNSGVLSAMKEGKRLSPNRDYLSCGQCKCGGLDLSIPIPELML